MKRIQLIVGMMSLKATHAQSFIESVQYIDKIIEDKATNDYYIIPNFEVIATLMNDKINCKMIFDSNNKLIIIKIDEISKKNGVKNSTSEPAVGRYEVKDKNYIHLYAITNHKETKLGLFYILKAKTDTYYLIKVTDDSQKMIEQTLNNSKGQQRMPFYDR